MQDVDRQIGHKGTRNTSKREIVDCWASRRSDDIELMACDWADAHNMCWRCGLARRLEKCHIVADSIGGLDEPSNYVLLCRRCHLEAPHTNDPESVWQWIERDHSRGFPGEIWVRRAKISLPAYVRLEQVDDLPGFIALFKSNLARCGIHPGDSTATVAWAMTKAYDSMSPGYLIL